jgi:hypothetical protein
MAKMFGFLLFFFLASLAFIASIAFYHNAETRVSEVITITFQDSSYLFSFHRLWPESCLFFVIIAASASTYSFLLSQERLVKIVLSFFHVTTCRFFANHAIKYVCSQFKLGTFSSN